MKQLFTEGRAISTVLIWTVYFMNLLNLFFLNSWLPTIISDAGIPVGTAIRLTSLFQIGGIAGALVLGRVLDRYFSFGVLAACYLWAALCIYFIGAVGASVSLLAVAITCAGVGIIGGQNASHALSSEFYPTRMRSTGVGWALGIGRIGSIVGPVVGGQLLAQGTPMRQVFWAAMVPAVIASMAAAGVAVIGVVEAAGFRQCPPARESAETRPLTSTEGGPEGPPPRGRQPLVTPAAGASEGPAWRTPSR